MKPKLIRSKRKKESWLKYFASLTHLWIGLLSSLIVFIVCLTGSIYAFRQQVENALDRELITVKTDLQNTRAPLTPLIDHFESKFGTPTTLQFHKDDQESVLISSARRGDTGVAAYYNPFSGQFQGTKGISAQRFFEFVLELHRFLLAGDIGKLINGTAVLMMVYMLVSGLILWFPNKLKNISKGLLVRFKARFYRVNYDLHRTLGFYALLLLLFIALTGLYVSFSWVKNGIIVGLGGESIIISESNLAIKKSLANSFKNNLTGLEQEKDNPDAPTISIDQVLQVAFAELPNPGMITVSLPDDNFDSYRLISWNNQNILRCYVPDKLEISRLGHVRSRSFFDEQPLHEQFKAIAKPLHTGEIMGLPGIILYFMVSLIGCSLPITGFVIWLKKSGK